MRAEAGHEHVERVSIDAAIMGGAPCIGGTRIPVATIVGMMAEGMDHDQVLDDFPQLTAADIEATLRYTASRPGATGADPSLRPGQHPRLS
jgi:uncharacterized protein (DUF433 family)